MMFYIFVKACKKYEFDFTLCACSGLGLILYPKNTFENINIDQGYYNHNFNKLFLKAIKEIKKYREERGAL